MSGWQGALQVVFVCSVDVLGDEVMNGRLVIAEVLEFVRDGKSIGSVLWH